MTAGQFALASLPVCAALAGLLLWIMSRDELLDDGALARRFLVGVSVCALLAFGIGRTEAVQLRLNPELRVQRQLEAWPVQRALEQALLPDEVRKLHAALAERAVADEPLEQTQRRLWSYLQRVGTERMGFAGPSARVGWARAMLSSLETLRERDAAACYAVMARQPLPDDVLPALTDDAQWTAFESAFVELIDSHTRDRDRLNPSEPRVAYEQAKDEYLVMQAPLVEKYGDAIMAALGAKPLPAEPVADTDTLCAARIDQLEAALARPVPMAGFLVDAILR